MLKKMRFLSPALMALLVTSAGFCVSGPPAQDDFVAPAGIWAHGDTVLLFAFFRQCEEDGGGYQPLQTLVSKDGGKTWARSGPRLVGSSFLYILNTGGETWIAGDSYAEGPAHGPFLHLFDPDNAEWPQFEIYDGYEEFRALAQDERNPDRFLAWIDHVEVSEPEGSHIFLHQSLDRGRTWHEVKEVKRVPKSMPGLRFFQDLPQQSGDWRINPAARTLEHKDKDNEWRTAVNLPLPIQNTCPD